MTTKVQVYIYEVDVAPIDGGWPGDATYDVHVATLDDIDTEDISLVGLMRVREAAKQVYEETFSRMGIVTEARYAGGIHPIDRTEVISVHLQPR